MAEPDSAAPLPTSLLSTPGLFDFSRLLRGAKRGVGVAVPAQRPVVRATAPAAPTSADSPTSLLPSGSFDLVSELIDNRRAYLCSADKDDAPTPSSDGSDNEASASYLSILSWPTSCRINIDRLRQHASEHSAKSGGNPHRIGQHPAVSCALHWGLGLIAASAPVLALQSLRLQFCRADAGLDPLISRTLDTFLNPSTGATYDLPSGSRANFRVPSGILRPLSDLAADIGVSRYALAVAATMASLSGQKQTNHGDAQDMRRAVERFLGTVDARARAIEALLREFAV